MENEIEACPQCSCTELLDQWSIGPRVYVQCSRCKFYFFVHRRDDFDDFLAQLSLDQAAADKRDMELGLF